MKSDENESLSIRKMCNNYRTFLQNVLNFVIIAFFIAYIIGYNTSVYADDNLEHSESDILIQEEEDEVINRIHNIRSQKEDVSTNALFAMSDDEIKQALLEMQEMDFAKNGSTGKEIENPLDYLHEYVGNPTDEYGIETHIINQSFYTTMEDHKRAHNNCTLTAFYNIMAFYKLYNGGQYSKLPSINSKARAYMGENMKVKNDRDFDTDVVYGNLSDPMPDSLYNLIEKKAAALGYDYDTSKGLSVTKNNNMVINVWKECGYTNIASSNNYAFTTQGALDFIDKKRPFMFSLASGVYYNHTLAVFGYKTYTNLRTREKYTFLVVADGWSHNSKYLPWTNTGAMYLGCFTSITTPDYNPTYK